MIPFLEHDDASRALMGSNMQRQAVPLIRSEAPFVGTGMEYRGAVDAGDVTVAEPAGRRHLGERRPDRRSPTTTAPTRRYRLSKFRRSNQGTCINQRPLVDRRAAGREGHAAGRRPLHRQRRDGARPQPAGRVHAVGGPQLRGRDHPAASGWCRTTSSPRSTSRSTRSTPATPSSVPRRSPATSPTSARRCWPISTSGASSGSAPRSSTGDILVGKVTPKGETELTPEERLLRAIFGEKAREVRDTSLKVPHGESGTVIGVRVFDRDSDDELAARRQPAGPGVRRPEAQDLQTATSSPAGTATRASSPRSCRSRTCRSWRTGPPVDIVLNPLGVPSRMNVGQVLETHLGWVAKQGWDLDGVEGAWADRLRDVGLGHVDGDKNLATPGVRRRDRGGDHRPARQHAADPGRRAAGHCRRQGQPVRRPLRRAVPRAGRVSATSTC